MRHDRMVNHIWGKKVDKGTGVAEEAGLARALVGLS